MKTQVFNRFGGGLLVLIALAIAVIAGQAEPNVNEPAATEDVLELDADFQITIDQERLAEPEALPSIIETAMDLPIRIDESIEESEAPATEIDGSDSVPVQ